MIRRIIRKVKISLRRLPLFKGKKNPNAIKWGILGLGNMAEIFATTISGDKDGMIYAVASRNVEKAKAFGNKHSCSKFYGSYYEMLNDKSLALDVIYVATPVKYHFENIKKCLLAGKNVLCEKPITSTSSQLKELISIAEENGCFLMEGMWMKCLPSFQKAKEWVRKGKIGEQKLVKVDFYKREWIRPELSIFNPIEEGGVLKDYGVYAISFATSFLGGVPDKIVANCRTSSFNIDSDWQIFAEKQKKKAFISLSSNFSSLSKAVIVGTEGSIEWNSQFNRTNTITLYDKFGKFRDQFTAQYYFEGFEYEVNEVHKCIWAGKTESSLVPLSESLDTLKFIDQLVSVRNKDD